MANVNEELRIKEIEELIQNFCAEYFNKEMESYALKLLRTVRRNSKLNIFRGQKEIWAASIIYVIARLNFLFDEESDIYITVDILCDYFDIKKSTAGNKATQIEKACNIALGNKNYCSEQISSMFNFVKTSEGFIIPSSGLNKKEFTIEFAEGKEAEELKLYAEKQKQIEEEKIQEKKARRAEINRKIAENKKKKKDDGQLNIF